MGPNKFLESRFIVAKECCSRKITSVKRVTLKERFYNLSAFIYFF